MLSVPITKNRDRREAMRLTKKLKYPETWYLFDSIHWRFDRFCCYFLFVRSFVVVMLPFSASRWQCQCINKCVGGINPPGLQSYAITFSVLFSLHFFSGGNVYTICTIAALRLWDFYVAYSVVACKLTLIYQIRVRDGDRESDLSQ